MDGSAWTSPDCKSNVIRGGSYSEFPFVLHVTARQLGDNGARGPGLGFESLGRFPPTSAERRRWWRVWHPKRCGAWTAEASFFPSKNRPRGYAGSMEHGIRCVKGDPSL